MDKLQILKEKIRSIESAVVAFSGGVDSAVFTAVAFDVLGDKMLAVTADSASVPSRDLESATNFCGRRKIPHLVIKTDEFSNEAYAANPDNRCFYCKSELFSALGKIAKEKGFKFVIEGTNSSELTGHRPGFEAARKNPNVATPYVDAGITKDEVRQIAKSLGLEVADRPSTACLSSRIPTGTKLDTAVLKRIDEAENFLISVGFAQVRLRHHGDVARIELDGQDMEKCLREKEKVVSKISSLGWKHVVMDLKGYRTGGGR